MNCKKMNLIKKILVEEKLTQQKLADLLGVDRSYICKMSMGHEEPSIPTKYKLKTLFPKYLKNQIINKPFTKTSLPYRFKNLRCIVGCYYAKVQNRFISVKRPLCPHCGGELLTKEERQRS